MKFLLIAVFTVAVAYFFLDVEPAQSSVTPTQNLAPSPVDSKIVKTASASDEKLKQAFENKQSNLQVRGKGRLVKILPDDTKGSKHQRFILELTNGQTLLVAHNIDLALRIKTLKKGDEVEFFGEYEWNSKGGVIHWTHHDPGKKHIDGWLKHNGIVYK